MGGRGARWTWIGAGVVAAASSAVLAVGPAGAEPPSSTEPASGGSDEAAPTTDDLVAGTEWHGEFTITIERWNYCGPNGISELVLADTITRTESFSFATSAPFEDESGAQETNPFYFSAGTDPEDPGTVNLTVFSAGLVSFDVTDEPMLTQYWNAEYVDGQLTGELVEDGREIGAAYNLMWDENPLVPCQPGLEMTQAYPMQEGATLVADFGDTAMSLVIEGRSVDEARRWTVEATATRQ